MILCSSSCTQTNVSFDPINNEGWNTRRTKYPYFFLLSQCLTYLYRGLIEYYKCRKAPLTIWNHQYLRISKGEYVNFLMREIKSFFGLMGYRSSLCACVYGDKILSQYNLFSNWCSLSFILLLTTCVI